MIAWSVPVVASWPVLAWVSRHVSEVASTGRRGSVSTRRSGCWHRSRTGIVLWSALTMLIEPVRTEARSSQAWDSAWSALLCTAFGGALATMALGFDPGLPPGWLRPLVLFAAGAVVVSLAAVTLLVPQGPARTGYLCVLFVMVCFPMSVQLIVITTDGG